MVKRRTKLPPLICVSYLGSGNKVVDSECFTSRKDASRFASKLRRSIKIKVVRK